jgi:NADPH:quinone reductase
MTGGNGAELVYDTVRGVTTPEALASLAPRGRLVVINAAARRTVEIDLYRNETRILGCNTLNLDVAESGARLNRLTPYFESGQFHPLPVANRYGLDHGMDAYLAVEEHVRGKVVICP